MFKNYLITAWKVFLRRKFFTFVNLFGISVTLAVIMVASTIAASYIYPVGPEINTQNYLIADRLTVTSKDNSNTHNGGLGYKFIQENIMRLQTPEMVSVNGGPKSVSIYKNKEKLVKDFRRTDANYWRIFEFDFIEGRAIDQSDLEDGRFVAVINEQMRKEFFAGQSALNKTIVVNDQRFTVIGVVADVPAVELYAFADIYVPYTTAPSTSYQEQWHDSWEAILYHSDPSQMSQIYDEYVAMLKNDVRLAPMQEDHIAYGGAFTKLENLSNRLFAGEYSYESGIEGLVIALSIALLLFMLLPSINMINLNVSRIMERASEIGVRKAFGASTHQLVGQFIVESIVLTTLGGILGIALSIAILSIVENSGLIPYANFVFSWPILFWGLFMILVFAIISGVYPAMKMSRLHPVTALKGGA